MGKKKGGEGGRERVGREGGLHALWDREEMPIASNQIRKEAGEKEK